MKDPSVLFYTQDFLVGSSMLTPLQKGHYITLLCYQQQSPTGSLPLKTIQSLMKKDFDKQWPAIKEKFLQDDNGFYNQRMRSEMERRSRYSESRRNNRKPNICKSYDSTYVPHMENENENENNKGGVGEKQKPPLGSEKVSGIANDCWGDKNWRDQLCIGLNIKNEQELKRWMAQFNSSISNDFVSGFNSSSYKKMIRGWILTQQRKGVTVEQKEQENPNYRLKKIS
jgi:uncharacterized protein YdaU (DUF1376 family)